MRLGGYPSLPALPSASRSSIGCSLRSGSSWWPDRCSSASDIGKRGNMPRRKSYRAPDSTTEMVGRTTFVPISTRSMALAKADRSSSGTQMLAWTSLRPVSSAGHGYQIQPRGLHRIHDRREFHQRVESAVSRTVLHAAANRTIPVVS